MEDEDEEKEEKKKSTTFMGSPLFQALVELMQ